MNTSTTISNVRPTTTGEHLAFRLGDQEYGLAISGVREIRFYEAPTRIAGSPTHILGVLDLRGESVPLIDLRVCLGITALFTASTVTVVANVGNDTFGMVVDSVSDVVELTRDQIREVPGMVGTEDSHGVIGIAQVTHEGSHRTLLLLDASQMISRIRDCASLDLSVAC
ncbi:chemotaxis protein CheW [Acidovorax sp. NPDC077693]|uniref:chemotaxis protein CheW n=1 Tax=unclassified Acidovorax TaxID=2684926 RepID=UPI0037C50E28